jgi:hypothetical protein
MNSSLVGGVVVLSLVAVPVMAAPAVDDLLCKRTDKSYDKSNEVMGIKALDVTSITSPDGARSVKNHADSAKGGFLIVDAKTGKSKAAHNKDRSYDCDSATAEDGTANSVRWLGNDTVFAQGWFCEEFAAKPYLVNAKTGKFVGYVKFPSVSPETIYHFAPLEGSLWAAAVFEHNSGWNGVVVFDAKSGKIKSTKKATPELLAKLPACPTK